jgi:Condensation domain
MTTAAHALPLGLSRFQTALWLRELLTGQSAALGFGLDFEPGVDVGRLDRALTDVVRRHPLLRARLAIGSEGLSMSIDPPPSTILTRLRSTSDTVDDWCGQRIGLREWPLCRAVVSSRRGETRLRVMVHHAVFDGESKDIFLRDLLRAYRGEALADRARPLLDAPFWRSALERERRSCGSSRARGGERAPAVRAPNAGDPLAPCSLGFALDARTLSSVGPVARDLGVSRFTVYLAAWHAALAHTSFQDADVVTAIALSTREALAADEIGPFVNQLPIRSKASRRDTFRTLALDLSHGLRRATANRQQRSTEASRNLAPPHEVMVSYRRSTLDELSWPDASAVPISLPSLPPATGSDVCVRMINHGDTLSGRIDANSSLIRPGFIRSLEHCWRTILCAGAQSPDVPLTELERHDAY